MPSAYEPSRTSVAPRGRRLNETDEEHQIQTLTRMFALFPKTNDPELSLAAYLDALADVTPLWLCRALYVLIMEDSSRKWLPSVPEIRGTAAQEIRKQWSKHHDRDRVAHPPTPLLISYWLSLARGENPTEVTIHLQDPPELIQKELDLTDPAEVLGF